MKILQVCARIPFPADDGGAVYVFNTTKYLHNIGNDIHVASLYSNKHRQDPLKFQDFCTLHFQDGNFKPYNWKAALKSILSRKPITVQHRMSKEIMGNILEGVDEKFDVILLEGLHTANFVEILRNHFPDTPLVLRHVNVEYELLSRNARNETNPFVSFFLRDQSKTMKSFEVAALQKMDAITFISDIDYSKLKPFLPSIPTLVNPPGAALFEKTDPKNRAQNELLAFSNWKWKPNIDGLKWFLDKIWGTLKNTHPQLTLTLAGDGLPKHIISKHDGINYLGFVEDLSQLKKRATIQIVPLISGSGVKLKIMEGLAAGLPIVSTSFGFDGVDAKDGIHYELANSPDEFIAKIDMLLSNQEKRKKLSQNAQSLIHDQFTWEKQIKRLDDFLKTLIN